MRQMRMRAYVVAAVVTLLLGASLATSQDDDGWSSVRSFAVDGPRLEESLKVHLCRPGVLWRQENGYLECRTTEKKYQVRMFIFWSRDCTETARVWAQVYRTENGVTKVKAGVELKKNGSVTKKTPYKNWINPEGRIERIWQELEKLESGGGRPAGRT
jgi:hypothetical protein